VRLAEASVGLAEASARPTDASASPTIGPASLTDGSARGGFVACTTPPAAVSLAALEDDLGGGVFGGVGEGEVRVRGAEALEEFARVAAQSKNGRARLGRSHLDVVPREAVAPARLKRLEGRLLGGEARGVVLRAGGAARVAVGALLFGEDALAEARRAREHFTHAPDFDNVYPDGDDHV